MNLYSVDIRVAATVYIKAENGAEAMRKARALNGQCLHVEDAHASDVAVSGLPYDDPDLPEVSVSPVMTIYGTHGNAEVAEENANRRQG